MTGVVIVGAGQAGLQAAVSLRQGGYDDSITLVSDETVLPYQRPPLSKAYLKPGYTFDRMLFRPDRFFAANKLTLVGGKTVCDIDREQKTVRLDDGSEVPYRYLVLALGARNRNLAIPGIDHPRIHQLRGISDAEALRGRLADARRLVIIGGGFIGLEVAAVARSLDKDVIILEGGPRLMARAVSPPISNFFLAAHRAMGTKVELGAQVEAISDMDGKPTIQLKSGEALHGDLVLIAAGVVPNQELAERAGIGVSNGILVEADLRTQDPDIFAIGDCARFLNPTTGERLRHESVPSAIAQAKSVADQILGKPAHEISIPWFWSEQGDFKLQMIGVPGAADTVVTSGVSNGSITTYCLKYDRLVGIETVNQPATHMAGRKIMADAMLIDPRVLVRPGFNLKDYVREELQKGG